MRTSLMSVAGIVFRIEGSLVTSASEKVDVTFSLLEGAHPRREAVECLASIYQTPATEPDIAKAISGVKPAKVPAWKKQERKVDRSLHALSIAEEAVLEMSEEEYEEYSNLRIKGNGRLTRKAHELRKMTEAMLY